MSTSAVPATIDYLVSTFTASTRLGAANPAVKVIDGIYNADDFPQSSLTVGMSNPDDNYLPVAATSQQSWVGPGNRAREEKFNISCAAEFWSGETDIKAARNGVYAIVAAVEDLVRTDANLGGHVLWVNPGVTNETLLQDITSKGAVARVTFTIDCIARIGA